MQKENRTLKRALDILQLIRSSARPLTAKEVSVAAMSHIMTNELSSRLGNMVAKSAQEISRRLGYTRGIYDGLFD